MPGEKTFASGEVLTAANMTTYFAQQACVVKSADENVTASTTLQPDDELSIAVSANTTYWLEAMIIYKGPSAGDIKIHWSLPSGATVDWSSNGLGTGAAGTVEVVSRSYHNAGSTIGLGCIDTSTECCALPMGVVVIGGTAGNVVLEWAQNTSNATPSTVIADSMMTLTRIT